MSATKLQSNNLVDNVPANWNTTLLRFLLKEKITDGPHETPVFVDDGFPFLSVDGIQNGELVFEGCRFISEEAHLEYSKKVKPLKGDLLMGKAASTGKIAQVKVDFEFSIWSPLAWIRPNEMISSDFLELALKSDYCQAQIEMLCTNSTQNNISMQDIPRIRIHHPCKNEQDNISRFLKEKISNLNIVEEQLNLELNLLEEKRSALITRLVTNGLSNDTTDWKNTKIKYCLTMKGRLGWQGLKADEYQDTGPYVVSSAHFSNYKIRWEQCPRVSLERYLIDENIQLREGDVLLMKDGAALGKIAQVSNQPDLACLNSHLLLLRPNSTEILEKFVFYLLDSMHFQDYMLNQGKGSTFLGVSQESIGNYAFSLPDTNEQIRIVKYLDEKIRLVDEISDNLIDKIKKCKELRNSLISTAVTGKIDVRSL